MSTLLEYYKERPVPPPLVIAREVVDARVEPLSVDEIKEQFDVLIDELQGAAFSSYLAYEKRLGANAIRRYFSAISRERRITGSEEMIGIVSTHFEQFDKMYLSIAQSRKSRAGGTFEYIINSLFEKLGYPFSRKPIINGEPDFLLPSVEYYRRLPTDCIIFTAKRTLRERWRQIISEGTRGLGFFLATIDKQVSDSQLNEMTRNRIYLVVPRAIKNDKYADKLNVISFSEFFESHLDPAIRRWRRGRIIT